MNDTIKCTLLITCFITSMLLSCSRNVVAESSQDSVTYVYRCPDGYEFIVNVRNETAWLFLPDQTIHARRIPSVSGARYQGTNVIFLSEGNGASITIGSGLHEQCVNDSKAAVWEGAKLRGADFRAVGNEPGWYLELDYQQISFVGDYGSIRHLFSTPEPVTDQLDRKTVYRTKNRDVILELILEGGKCHDTMSGEDFETSVTILLNSSEYTGCGRALH